jgi:hypothetical protein
MADRRKPKISIAKIVQRGNDLVMICNQDKEDLLKVGLQWEIVLKLGELVDLCSDADAQYQLRKESLRLATKLHQDFLRECKQLRSNLRETINWAFGFNYPGIKVPSLYQNKLKTDIVQDLFDLANICRAHHIEFEKVRFDFSLAERAATVSEELSISIADLDLQRESIKHEEMYTRDLLYNEIYDTIKEICIFGRYIFKNDPARRKRYCSIK